MRVVTTAKHVAAEVTFATNSQARTSLLVIFKATYSIPANNRVPRPLLPPQPVAVQDSFAGEPGLSAVLHENDLAGAKSSCDVVFNASAHSPDGTPKSRLDVAVQVGGMSKQLRVWGERVWEQDILLLRASRPKPFTSMPLHYGHAFGGAHSHEEDQSVRWDVFQENPFGRGYIGQGSGHNSIHGLPLPNLEAPGAPITTPWRGTATALSPLPRTVPARAKYAGTYDQHWKDEYAPFLPPDFDERFFHCVPEDQRIPYPRGGEEVVLLNMMPGRPEVRFRLPRLDVVPVRVLHRDYTVSEPIPNVDTLYFEPDEGRFSVVWRAQVPLGLRGAHEVRLAVVGQPCERWWEGVRSGGTGCHGCGAKVQIEAGLETGSKETTTQPCPESPEGPLMPAVFIEQKSPESHKKSEGEA